LLKLHFPGRARAWGGVAKDDRLFMNALFRIMRTGAPWPDLLPDPDNWNNTHRRLIR